MDPAVVHGLLHATEQAALASFRWAGMGDRHKADEAAVEAMRAALNPLAMQATVVIGEGERDMAPMLFIGEKLGKGGLPVDIAVDPLECTNNVATASPNAIAVLAAGPAGSLFGAPDVYMDKIAAGPQARGLVGLDRPVVENVAAVAKSLGKDISDVTVVVLERDRNQQVIGEVRKTGARVKLISDGDLPAAVATCLPDSGIDLLLGIGAAPEGVLSAVALKHLGGEFQGRLWFKNREEKVDAERRGVLDPDQLLTLDALVKDDRCAFLATGVMDGMLVKGVRLANGTALTHSMIVEKNKVRYIRSRHTLE